eukprot:TRINITY_DN65926_c0_g2_i1.p1 TRINITY_DN65926_c0_g2~~TRINITY_DN65926_c0_g2_i1.p1  ORF type:complete len:693 (+),score=40.92 TRINITY_DN65926_c0_g2_i1:74-2152(+)
MSLAELFAPQPSRLDLSRKVTTLPLQQELVQIMRTNSSVAELNLEGNHFQNFDELVSAILSNPNCPLRVLVLRNTGIDRNSVLQVARLVERSVRLQKLDVSSNAIGEDAMSLIRALQNNERSPMTVVNLANNEINSLNVPELQHLLMSREQLYIHLAGNTILMAADMAKVREFLQMRAPIINAQMARSRSQPPPAPQGNMTPRSASTGPVVAPGAFQPPQQVGSHSSTPGGSGNRSGSSSVPPPAPPSGGQRGPQCTHCSSVMTDYKYKCMRCPGFALCVKCYGNAAKIHNPDHAFVGLEIDMAKWLANNPPGSGAASGAATTQAASPAPPTGGGLIGSGGSASALAAAGSARETPPALGSGGSAAAAAAAPVSPSHHAQLPTGSGFPYNNGPGAATGRPRRESNTSSSSSSSSSATPPHSSRPPIAPQHAQSAAVAPKPSGDAQRGFQPAAAQHSPASARDESPGRSSNAVTSSARAQVSAMRKMLKSMGVQDSSDSDSSSSSSAAPPKRTSAGGGAATKPRPARRPIQSDSSSDEQPTPWRMGKRRDSTSSASSSDSSRKRKRGGRRSYTQPPQRYTMKHDTPREHYNAAGAPPDKDERNCYGFKEKQTARGRKPHYTAPVEVPRGRKFRGKLIDDGNSSPRTRALRARMDFEPMIGPGWYAPDVIKKPKGTQARGRPAGANTRGRPVWL